ncbi:MAG: NAD(P)H-dependent oxidoreductase [Candidatus Woesearchaeota archaeon]
MADVLVIYAHPDTGGHNKSILDHVIADLDGRGVSFEVIDLYKLKYDPVLHEKEHYTAGKRQVSAQNRRFQKKIGKADRLVFIYPVWWGLMPAVLKGFLDRVLTPHFAYRYRRLPFSFFGLSARPVGLLKGKKAAVFMTIGAPRWLHRLFSRDAQQFLARHNILGFCGVKARTFTLSGCDKALTKKKEKKIDKLVSRGLRWLF